MNPVQQRIDQLALGDPTVYGQMTLFPLIDSHQSHADYTVMDDVLRDGSNNRLFLCSFSKH